MTDRPVTDEERRTGAAILLAFILMSVGAGFATSNPAAGVFVFGALLLWLVAR